jgi:hypothetical protein
MRAGAEQSRNYTRRHLQPLCEIGLNAPNQHCEFYAGRTGLAQLAESEYRAQIDTLAV